MNWRNFDRRRFALYIEARRQWLRSLLPGGCLLILIGGFFLFGFVYVLGREVKLVSPLSWSAVGFVLLGAFLLTPSRVVFFWLNLPRLVRAIVAAIASYTLIVILGHLVDVVSFSAVWELLTLTGGAPFSAVHFVAVLAGAYFYWVQRGVGPGEPREVTVRGPTLISHEDAALATISDIQRRSDGKHAAPSIFWGAVPLALARGTEHFCIVGEPGSGKTISLRLMLQTLVPHLGRGSNRRALIYDAKRDALALLSGMQTPCEVKSLNPFDARGYAWELAEDLGDDPRLPIELASIFVPMEGDQPFFPRAGQALVGGVIETFQKLTQGKAERWTLRDVVLALRYPWRVKTILSAGPGLDHLAEIYIGDDPTETERSIGATVENALRRLSYVAGAWEDAREKGRTVSLRSWLSSEFILLLGSDPEGESILRDLNGILFKRLTQMVRGQDETSTRQTWFVIDELRHAGRLDGLVELLTFCRSKGACVVLGFQDIGGLEHAYGTAGAKLAREIVGACGNKAFLRTTDPDTQKFASEQFGDQEVEIPRWSSSESWGPEGKSASRSFQYQRERRPVILPSQFADNLPRPDKALNIGVSGFYQTAAVHAPYHATVKSEAIGKGLSGMGTTKAYEPRDLAAYQIADWTERDLRRLGLGDYPELIARKKQASGIQPASEPDAHAGSWRSVFRGTA